MKQLAKLMNVSEYCRLLTVSKIIPAAVHPYIDSYIIYLEDGYATGVLLIGIGKWKKAVKKGLLDSQFTVRKLTAPVKLELPSRHRDGQHMLHVNMATKQIRAYDSKEIDNTMINVNGIKINE